MIKRLSIGTALVGSFTLILVVAIGAILYFAYSTGFSATRELTQARMAMIVNGVRQHTVHFMNPAIQQVRYLRGLVDRGQLDLHDRERLFVNLRAALAGADQIETLAYIDPAGATLIATRGGDRIETAWRDERSRRELLKRLRGTTSESWGRVEYVPQLGGSVIDALAPIQIDAGFAGGFVATLRLAHLSRILPEFSSNQGETPFILTADRVVVAHPSLQPSGGADERVHGLHSVDTYGDPILAAMWDPSRSSALGPLHLSDALHGFAVRHIAQGPDLALLVSRELPDYGESPWTIGVHFPLQQVARQLRLLRDSALLSLAVLILAVGAAVYLGRRLSRPVLLLGRKAQELGSAALDRIEPLPPSRISEIDQASQAFNSMLGGLRQREALYATFGKFVPASLVDALVADRGMLQPVTREATILYCDIVGFSTLSETMAPDRILLLLNAYFSVLAEIIERRGGVIHQFQGDAVLATFNLPIQNFDHADDAIQAALEIQEALRHREFADGLRVSNRIGLNSGTIVGGTVGSAGRLGYTVHGDAVNLAARVEELNKHYKTSLLITHDTRILAALKYDFERVAEVPVRGRSQTVILYRVSTPAADADPHRVEYATPV